MPYVISSLIALVVCTILGSVLPPVLTYLLIGLVSIFMIGLVLIQRGRGGGLAGAFGGVGGSSAFGTRAGDVFTRITIVTASVWIALNMGLVVKANRIAAQAQAQPGASFLPQGVETGPGGMPLGTDLDDLDLGDPDGGDTDPASSAPASPSTSAPADAPADLPPALDDGPSPGAEDTETP